MPQFSHSAGGVVLNKHGEVLVVNQRDNTWSLPKGGIKDGEDPRETAIREIAEESGIKELTMIKILKSYSRYAMSNTGREDTDKFKRITMYLFTTEQEELRPMDPRNPEARWVPKQEVAALLSNPKDQDFFEEVMPELNLLLTQR
jgi:8-oxo-dGTP pyrophosphatase MutT (NUDIX family)